MFLSEDCDKFYNRMTAEEIAEVLAVQFPDISQFVDKILANARRNPNIATISRNSTYTMKEWADTDE